MYNVNETIYQLPSLTDAMFKVYTMRHTFVDGKCPRSLWLELSSLIDNTVPTCRGKEGLPLSNKAP